jgi:hypothetical protein
MMLEKHKDTLEELTVSDFLLLGPWNKVLSIIRDKLRLDKLVLIKLSAANQHEFRSNSETRTCHNFTRRRCRILRTREDDVWYR